MPHSKPLACHALQGVPKETGIQRRDRDGIGLFVVDADATVNARIGYLGSAPYVGALGSRRAQDRRRERMLNSQSTDWRVRWSTRKPREDTNPPRRSA